MSVHHTENPWNLTPGEVRVMDAYIKDGNYKRVCDVLKIGPSSMSSHMTDAKRKMKVPHSAQAAIKWYLWRHGDGRGVPA
jgi:DNA-binding CsgD family transcriptional regulator